jgi:hypothetical protein
LKIKDNKGTKNLVADHLSQLHLSSAENVLSINDSFIDEQLHQVNTIAKSWFADLDNYLACGIIPPELTYRQKKKFMFDAKYNFWDDPYLFKLEVDGIHRRFIPQGEIQSILVHCHSSPYVVMLHNQNHCKSASI